MNAKLSQLLERLLLISILAELVALQRNVLSARIGVAVTPVRRARPRPVLVRIDAA